MTKTASHIAGLLIVLSLALIASAQITVAPITNQPVAITPQNVGTLTPVPQTVQPQTQTPIPQVSGQALVGSSSLVPVGAAAAPGQVVDATGRIINPGQVSVQQTIDANGRLVTFASPVPTVQPIQSLIANGNGSAQAFATLATPTFTTLSTPSFTSANTPVFTSLATPTFTSLATPGLLAPQVAVVQPAVVDDRLARAVGTLAAQGVALTPQQQAQLALALDDRSSRLSTFDRQNADRITRLQNLAVRERNDVLRTRMLNQIDAIDAQREAVKQQLNQQMLGRVLTDDQRASRNRFRLEARVNNGLAPITLSEAQRAAVAGMLDATVRANPRATDILASQAAINALGDQIRTRVLTAEQRIVLADARRGRGSDDGIGHIRRGRGSDDGIGHIRGLGHDDVFEIHGGGGFELFHNQRGRGSGRGGDDDLFESFLDNNRLIDNGLFDDRRGRGRGGDDIGVGNSGRGRGSDDVGVDDRGRGRGSDDVGVDDRGRGRGSDDGVRSSGNSGNSGNSGKSGKVQKADDRGGSSGGKSSGGSSSGGSGKSSSGGGKGSGKGK